MAAVDPSGRPSVTVLEQLTRATIHTSRGLVAATKTEMAFRSWMVLYPQFINPNPSIIGNVELLSDPSRRRDRTVVDAVQRDAQRMARVVDGLLYLSRVADPDHPREFATVDLHELLRRVVELAEPAAARSRLTVQLRQTPAPSVRPAELPAVTRPPGRNGVGSSARPSSEVSGRRNSS